MADFTINEECCICFCQMKLPYFLECKHIFCYLCIKQSLFSGNKKCPMCRNPISNDIIENASSKFQEPESLWLYASRSKDGWWYYDENTSDIIEKGWQNYNNGPKSEKTIQINIIGMNCTINFEKMIQISDTYRYREIIRKDKVDITKIKGSAGLQKTF